MIDPVKQMAKYIRDLLGVKECNISLGRINEYDEQKPLLIIIDDLSPAQQISVTKGYDGVTETETIDALMNGQFTVDFYGDTARENAFLFATLNNTESARTLQKTHEISVFRLSQISNLKQLAGKTYHERYEITVNLSYNITKSIDTLRFDTAQFSFLNDK